MDRPPSVGYGRLAVGLILLAITVSASGCVSALATAMWLIRGSNVPAEYAGLRGKKVVVVCRPLTSSVYRNPGVAKDISRAVSRLLREHLPRTEVVDQRKVAEWMDTNLWDEYTEIGRALEADLVLGIDLEDFSIYESQTLYQGKANFAIKVYDGATGQLVFEKQPPQAVYPPNHYVPTQDQQASAFRREFVQVLSDQIARHFYSHDPRANWAEDAAAMH